MLHFALDILFPQEKDASLALSLPVSPVILDRAHLRRHSLLFLDRVIGAADYKKASQLHDAIHRLKYRGIRGGVGELGKMMAATPLDGGVLCPVPLHWIRRFSRGFNQSHLLATEVSNIRGWEVRSLLKRSRWTGSQVGRKRGERMAAMDGAFVARSMAMPEHVILVDDVFTTGATMDACAKALKRAGVRVVEGLAIAVD